MKIFLLILLFFVSYLGFSQNNYIVKTDDGRRVLLKADYTWEYIDLEKPGIDNTLVTTTPVSKITKKDKEKNTAETDNTCKLAEDFTEPELNSKIQSQLKKGRATIEDVKSKVAKDFDCEVEEVILLSVREQKARATYGFCVKGTAVTYKRNGYSIAKSIKLF